MAAPPIGSLHAVCLTSTRGSGSTAPEPNTQVPTPQKAGTVLVSEDKFTFILLHCGLKARNTDSVLASLVLALAFKEQRVVPPGLLTFTAVRV